MFTPSKTYSPAVNMYLPRTKSPGTGPAVMPGESCLYVGDKGFLPTATAVLQRGQIAKSLRASSDARSRIPCSRGD